MSPGPRAYYNEIDPYCCAWLKNLIAAGLIADGDVDARSIDDVSPADVAGYTQCHFFAGLGGWSYALRLAGWPDTRPVWTGSCPCQPFSAAGKGAGFADERHLWPAFHWLISQCRPGVVFGEQVGSPGGLGWWDLVATDLEALDYAVGESDLPAACVQAPHLRQRLYWLAVTAGRRCDGRPSTAWIGPWPGPGAAVCGATGELAIAERSGGGTRGAGTASRGAAVESDRLGAVGELGNAGGPGGWRDPGAVPRSQGGGGGEGQAARRLAHQPVAPGVVGHTRGKGLALGPQPEDQPGALRVEGPAARATEPVRWDDADWIWCRDGKHRPVEPGTFPLAHGVPARVGRLRAYGNAIVPQVAATFIQAAIGAIDHYRGWL